MSLPSFPAARFDLEAYADADFPGAMFQLVDGGGDPIDLTGWTLTYTVRSFDDAAGAALITQAVTWVDQTQGQFTIGIDKAVIGALPRNSSTTNQTTTFRHQLKAVQGSQDVRLAFGDLRVWGII